MMSFEQSETDRMLAGLLVCGTIESVQYKPPRVRVRSGDWVSSYLPWKSMAAGNVRHWRPPSVGEQAMILSPSGLPEQGFVIAGFDTDQFPANDDRGNITATDWPDGAREHYDHDAHEYVLSVPAGGRIVLTIGGTKLEMKSDGTTLTTPKLTVDSPDSTFTGKVLIQKLLTYIGGLVGKGGGGGGASASIEGGIRVTNGDITADNISLKQHTHTEQGDGAKTSAAH